MFRALECMDDDDDDNIDIDRALEIIRKNMKVSATMSAVYYDLTQHKQWLEEDCSKLLDERKQAKLHHMQNSSQTNGDDLKK
jgi:hypothetical protein